MDDLIAQAADLLFRAGWRGAIVAVALVLLFVLGRAGVKALPTVKVEPADDPDHRDRNPSVLTDSNGTPLQPRTDDDGGQG